MGEIKWVAYNFPGACNPGLINEPLSSQLCTLFLFYLQHWSHLCLEIVQIQAHSYIQSVRLVGSQDRNKSTKLRVYREKDVHAVVTTLETVL